MSSTPQHPTQCQPARSGPKHCNISLKVQAYLPSPKLAPLTVTLLLPVPIWLPAAYPDTDASEYDIPADTELDSAFTDKTKI